MDMFWKQSLGTKTTSHLRYSSISATFHRRFFGKIFLQKQKAGLSNPLFAQNSHPSV